MFQALIMFAVLVVAGAPAAMAEPALTPASTARKDVTAFDMVSTQRGRAFRIQVFTPAQPPPPGGFPVLFVTDAAITFNQAADNMRVRSIYELTPAIIVGIGYPTDDLAATVRLRMIDLTPTKPNEGFLPTFKEWAAFGGSTTDDAGGAEDLYRFITRELLPRLEKDAPIDRSNLALFGHSLGGLFALHCLFEHPETFRTIAASSPTIAWNDREILQAEPRLTDALKRGVRAPRILLAVGSLERPPPSMLAAFPPDRILREVRQGEGVGNVLEMAGRLRALPGGAEFVQSVVFQDENHNSVIPASVSRTLTVAFTPARKAP